MIIPSQFFIQYWFLLEIWLNMTILLDLIIEVNSKEVKDNRHYTVSIMHHIQCMTEIFINRSYFLQLYVNILFYF